MVMVTLGKSLKKKSSSIWPGEEEIGLVVLSGAFCSQGTFGNIWRHVWFSQWERCSGHLIGGGQGCS